MQEYMFRLNDYFFYQLMPPLSDSNPFKWLNERLDKGEIPKFVDGVAHFEEKHDLGENVTSREEEKKEN